MSTEARIVCAAIRAKDGSLLLGLRHYSHDMHLQIAARTDGQKFLHRHGNDQGFVDQRGQYYTRAQAWRVACKNNQIIRTIPGSEGKLYSENLY